MMINLYHYTESAKSLLTSDIVLPSKPLDVNLANSPLEIEVESIITLFVLAIPFIKLSCLLPNAV